MTDVDRLLKTYIERFETGDSTDPTDLLAQAEGQDRARLSALIEGYLEHAARPQHWDAEAFDGSAAKSAVELLEEDWAEESSALPAQLVALRKQAQLRRASLVDSLAGALGATEPAQREKVATYYNAMEHSQVETSGISNRVFEVLAGILGTTADALRKAGEAVAPSAGGQASPAFARTTRIEMATDDAALLPGPQADSEPDPDPSEWDEIDRLFRGGDDA